MRSGTGWATLAPTAPRARAGSDRQSATEAAEARFC